MLRNYPAYFPEEEKQYTVEIYKRDGRRASGERLVKKYNLGIILKRTAEAHGDLIQISQYPVSKGYRVEIY